MAGTLALSVIRFDEGKKQFKLEAALARPFSDASLITTKLSDQYDEAMFELDSTDRIVRYDFAAYRIAENDVAFGIRTGHDEIYSAGGFAYSEMLHLFHMKNDSLNLIASILVYHMSDLAGDWTDEGYRDRHTNEQKWILIMGSESRNGYITIIVREVGNRSNTITLVWNDTLGIYE
jgi:hypothetical protein